MTKGDRSTCIHSRPCDQCLERYYDIEMMKRERDGMILKKMFLLEHLNEARTEADESRNENLKPYISFQVICLVKYNAVELS